MLSTTQLGIHAAADKNLCYMLCIHASMNFLFWCNIQRSTYLFFIFYNIYLKGSVVFHSAFISSHSRFHPIIFKYNIMQCSPPREIIVHLYVQIHRARDAKTEVFFSKIEKKPIIINSKTGTEPENIFFNNRNRNQYRQNQNFPVPGL